MINTVCTLYELTSGENTVSEGMHFKIFNCFSVMAVVFRLSFLVLYFCGNLNAFFTDVGVIIDVNEVLCKFVNISSSLVAVISNLVNKYVPKSWLGYSVKVSSGWYQYTNELI